MHIKRDYYYKIVDSIEYLYNLYPPAFSKLVAFYYNKTIDKSIFIEELNCIYVPIPKVGTKSVKQVLANFLYRENSDNRFNRTQSDKKQLPFKRVDKTELTDLKDENFIFSFVRNPYDRILSCYFDKINKKTSYMGFLRYEGLFYRGMTFEEFIRNISEIPDSDADQHFRSQHKFLENDKNELIPHFVGKLESMTDDFKKIVDHLNTDKLELIHMNKSKARWTDSGKYFTPEITELIRQRYAKDFQLFNYSTDITHYL